MTDKKAQTGGDKLDSFREKLRENGLQACLILHDDEWKNEYPPPCGNRLEWLTGFGGSAGLAAVTLGKALVATDGRYEIAVAEATDPALFDIRIAGLRGQEMEQTVAWLADALPQGSTIGYDPFVLSQGEVEEWSAALGAHNIAMTPVPFNPVDAVWNDRPAFPDSPAEVYPLSCAGKSSADKRRDLGADLKAVEADSMFIASPREIAWLLNIRGRDIPHVPVVLSYALAHRDGTVDLFVEPDKIPDDVRDHLGPDVRLHDLSAARTETGDLAKGGVVAIDNETVPAGFRALFPKTKPIASPVAARMEIKNATEIEGIIEGHIIDGIALVKFWKWIDEEAHKGNLREQDIAEKLLAFRKENEYFVEPSFPSIVGWNANGADMHYDGRHNVLIKGDGILLVDSGGQYKGSDKKNYSCTTDNTNTWAIGTPTEAMRRNNTRALKGHIAVAATPFKTTTKGRDIDSRARTALHRDKAGLDFNHSTGHDVDAYGSVHGNHARLTSGGENMFVPGQLMSNEPGYYEAGAYGIRHERLVLVEENPDSGKLSLRFRTVALTPFDKNLLWLPLLDEDEIAWLNDYHRTVYDTLSPRLDAATKEWLKKRTMPIVKDAPESVPLFALNPHALR